MTDGAKRSLRNQEMLDGSVPTPGRLEAYLTTAYC